MKAHIAWSALVATAAALLLASGGGAGGVREGGTFRTAVAAGSFDSIDPAIANLAASIQLLRPVCAKLLNTPSKRPPAGLRYEPELATDFPVVSRNGLKQTFTIRSDARFSTGAPVLARDVAHSLERVLNPAVDSIWAPRLVDLVGAQAIRDGTTTRLSGATATGRTLTLRLRKPVIDLAIRASVCVVPASVAVEAEGAKAPLPSPAPYYVAEYTPGERLVLQRNRYYRGSRPHQVDRFVADLSSDVDAVVERVERGAVEFAYLGGASWSPFVEELTQRYGINRSQFFSVPGTFLRMFLLNTSRPLFRNNPRLRQAVNFAVDRRALIREFGRAVGTPTDQYMPPIFPGFREERIYPLQRPDVRTARRLADGRTRSGKVVLYTIANPVGLAQAQILERNLRAIGLELETVQFPAPLLFEKLATDRGGFDIGWIGWGMGGPEAIGGIHDGRTIGQPGNQNWSYFDSPTYNRLIATAEALPLGRARERAYGDLDIRLSRDAAPGIPYGVSNALTFVSAKVGCIVLNPFLDLTAVCLK